MLRCWHPQDAPLLKSALEISWDELQRWIPWVFAQPESVQQLEERLRGYREDFLNGANALYAVMDLDESEVWGGAGLYRRVGPGGIERIEIRCDPEHGASSAIPRKLGYRHRETLLGEGCVPAGDGQDTMIWELTPEEYGRSGS